MVKIDVPKHIKIYAHLLKSELGLNDLGEAYEMIMESGAMYLQKALRSETKFVSPRRHNRSKKITFTIHEDKDSHI